MTTAERNEGQEKDDALLCGSKRSALVVSRRNLQQRANKSRVPWQIVIIEHFVVYILMFRLGSVSVHLYDHVTPC